MLLALLGWERYGKLNSDEKSSTRQQRHEESMNHGHYAHVNRGAPARPRWIAGVAAVRA